MTNDNQNAIIKRRNICIKFYFLKTKSGENEVQNYIKKLQNNNNKTDRIKLNKIIAYMRMLEEKGLALGEPYIKHISGNIWEMRPLRDRILFATLENNKFIILNQFIKMTQKTPRREIEKAKRILENYKKGVAKNE